MDGKQLQSQYKDHLSDFQNWDQRAHAQEYILYPKNMGYHLCIDETALSKGAQSETLGDCVKILIFAS